MFIYAQAHTVPVIMYHHISNDYPAGETVVSIDDFKNQIKILDELGYQTITVSTLVQYMEGKIDLPEKTVVITIDDGWKDNLIAAEILKNYNQSATFYVLSGMFEHPSYLSKDELISLSKNSKFEIGAHTHTHFMKWVGDLTQADDVTMVGEISMSKIMIERVIGKPVATFAWPFGYSRPNIVDFAKDIGFTSTSHVNSQSDNQPGTSTMYISRINIDGRCSKDIFISMIETGKLIRCDK